MAAADTTQKPTAGQAAAAGALTAPAALSPAAAAAAAHTAATTAAAQATANVIGSLLKALAPRAGAGDASVYALVLGMLDDRYPERPRADLADIARVEQSFEQQFQEKMVARLERDLPAAFRIRDSKLRQEAVQSIVERERRIYELHEKAVNDRALAHADQLYLRDLSPQGAYWRLGVAERHCPICLAWAGKVWPWSVLRTWGPPVHPNCACTLESVQDALRAGWVSPGDIPDDAVALDRAKRLTEAIDAADADGTLEGEELHEFLSQLEESPLRWAKGFAHGGEFRPQRGGDAGRRILPRLSTLVHPHVADPAIHLHSASIPNYDGVALELGKSAGGSNGARWAKDIEGDRWLVKTYGGDQNRVATEVLANAIYREMGAKVANAGTIDAHIEPDFTHISDVAVHEPDLPKPSKGSRVSSGMVVREPDGRVWVYEPKGKFGGYEHTFPKGGVEHGLTGQQNAHKELWEETGLRAAVTGYLGDYKGSTGVTRYYTAVRVGGEPHAPDNTPYETGGNETASVKLLAPVEAKKHLNVKRDHDVLADALKVPVPLPSQVPHVPAPPQTARALAYPTLDGEVREYGFDKGPSAKLGEHFMTDALLANWDFVGMSDDNVLWQGDEPVRLDQGGTFSFRAQGSKKPYGPVPNEVWTMMGPKGQGFRAVQVTPEQKRAQAAAIAKTLTPERVDQLVDAAPFTDEKLRTELRRNLNARVQWMGRYAKGDEHEPAPLTGDAAGEALTKASGELAGEGALDPDEQWALDAYHEDEGEINDFLKGKRDARSKDIVRLLDGLITETKAPDDFVAYIPTSGHGNVDHLLGKTTRYGGYLDASLDQPDGPALRVTVPKGAPMLYLTAVGELGHRVLMPHGSRIKVLRRADPYLDVVVVP